MSRPPATARSVALDLLAQVLDHGHTLDNALAALAAQDELSARDRAAARMLTATVLRRLGQIDDLIDACLDRPLSRKARPMRRYLRLGVVQLMFLGTAAHATLDTTVEMVRRDGHPQFAGLVNAVLRRLVRDGEGMVAGQDAARLNTPDWLWNGWIGDYGETTTRAIAAAHLDDPPLDVTVKSDPRGWAERLDATMLPTGSLRRRAGGRIESLPGYRAGQWWIQDAAAGLPARLFGDIAGREVIDLCAAPGGKTAQLAAMGANVTAVDKSPRRLARLKENLKRLGAEARCATGDAVSWRPQRPADAVLLDAPCTSTGTIRRHPDIPRLKAPRDVATMAALQDALLDAAVEMVRPGGMVVYCTCSLQPEEGPARIEALLSRGAPVDVVPIRKADVNGLDELVADGWLRTLPCHFAEFGGIDGFFAARLRVQ